jgi:hypothetical protein
MSSFSSRVAGSLLLLALGFLLLGACGGSTHAADDGGPSTQPGPGTSSPGSATLSGPQGFPVGWASTGPTSDCGPSTASGGGLAAASIVFFEQDVSSLVCADGGPVNGVSGRVVLIEIATSQYAKQTTPLTESLGPATYVIGDEGEDDEDLCMLPSGTTAFLEISELGDGGAVAEWIGISGTVTVDSITPTSIAGSFDVLLGGPYGQTDGSAPPSLSGTFDAAGCP